MTQWILGYTMFVLGIFWVGWDSIGPGALLWGLGSACFFCSLAGGFLWWLDERRWQQETRFTETSTMKPGSCEGPMTGSPNEVQKQHITPNEFREVAPMDCEDRVEKNETGATAFSD